MHGLLRCNIKAGVHARARGADVSLRNVSIARDGKQGYTVRVMSRTGSARRILGEFEKSQWVENWTPNETADFRLLAETFVVGATRVGSGGGRWKSQYRKIVPLSLCRRTFKLKGNKMVRTWTKKSLRVFRISRSYVLCYIYEHYMSISHMAVSGYGTNKHRFVHSSFVRLVITSHLGEPAHNITAWITEQNLICIYQYCVCSV